MVTLAEVIILTQSWQRSVAERFSGARELRLHGLFELKTLRLPRRLLAEAAGLAAEQDAEDRRVLILPAGEAATTGRRIPCCRSGYAVLAGRSAA